MHLDSDSGHRTMKLLAEYEALLAGLSLASEVKVESIIINNDSQLVVNQINEQYQAKGMAMRVDLERAKALLRKYKEVKVQLISCSKNIHVVVLAKLALIKAKGSFFMHWFLYAYLAFFCIFLQFYVCFSVLESFWKNIEERSQKWEKMEQKKNEKQHFSKIPELRKQTKLSFL